MSRIFHVSKEGSDLNEGSKMQAFASISKAANVAQSGDTIIVHEGTYRECVKPSQGGHSDLSRITYQAAQGEKVIIKGSEIITQWEQVEGSLWKVTLSNDFFKGYNPYKELLFGDWLVYPSEWSLHLGDVYLNGHSLYEAESLEALKKPRKRTQFQMPLSTRVEYLPYPEDTIYQWYAEVTNDTTTIYANFQAYNPNHECTEINVRQSCFYPEKIGMNYITVSGFEMAHAASPWAPPTADQIGLIGPNWAKGWIIENNIIHDAKCSAISIGKEASTGHNLATRTQQKSGYQYQMEAVFKALQLGWSKETIGSHIIRNNTIYDCGQNGIVGHLGCIYSQVYHNHIYNIGIKHEYFGWEIAAIKFHAPIDVEIRDNHIHNCTLGLWLDWQSQGTRVSKNLLYRNDRDCTIEVTHGPLILDNNIFASAYNFDNHAQGTAYINNLFCGSMKCVKIKDRATPYHFPHSTQVAGYAFVYGGDDRLLNNIYVGGQVLASQRAFVGTAGYNKNTDSYEAYHEKIVEKGMRDEDKFTEVEQPVTIDGNVYLKEAEPFDREEHHYLDNAFDPNIKIITEGSEVFLEITLPKEALEVETSLQTTHTLGKVRLVDAIYDDPSGQPVILNKDYHDQARSAQPTPGPFEALKAGHNRLKVWPRPIQA